MDKVGWWWWHKTKSTNPTLGNVVSWLKVLRFGCDLTMRNLPRFLTRKQLTFLMLELWLFLMRNLPCFLMRVKTAILPGTDVSNWHPGTYLQSLVKIRSVTAEILLKGTNVARTNVAWTPITNVRPWEDRRFYPHEETGKIPHEE